MKRILIVDDAAFMRMSLRKIMEESGDFEVVGEAENGRVALEKYKELRPDIVTLDITMPEMDGLTALKELIKIDHNATVIIVSAMGQESYVRESVMAGAKNFIVKPFNKDHVLKILKSL